MSGVTEDSAGDWVEQNGFAHQSNISRIITNETGRQANASFLEEDDEYILDSPKVKAALIAIYTIVFLVCVCGNLIVVCVIKLHWRMQGTTKFGLANLAFANLCVGLFCVYQNLSLYLIDSWVFGKFLCKMYHFVNTLSHTASILIMVVITVERYLAILHPFKCRSMLTTLRLRLVVLGVWILSAVISSPRLYFIKLIPTSMHSNEGGTYTEVLCSLGPSVYTSESSDLVQFLFLFCLPLLIMSILYAKIIVHLWKRHTLLTFRTGTSFTACDSETSTIQTEISLVDFTRRSSERKRLSSKTRLSKVEGRKTLDGEVSIDLGGNVVPQGADSVSAPSQSTGETDAESKISLFQRKRKTRGRRRTRGEKSTTSRQLSQQSTVLRINFPRSNAQNASLDSGAVGDIKRSHARVVGILLISVGTFAACNLPYHLRKLNKNYIHAPENESAFTELATPLSFLLMYTNCAINPFIYAFMSKSFRLSFQDILRCKLKRPAHP